MLFLPRAVRALSIVVLLTLLTLAACVHPDHFVATSGRDAGDDQHTALLVSAQHDLQCDVAAMRDYDLDWGTSFEETAKHHARPMFMRTQVVEGCGMRAVYKSQCKREVPVPPGMTPDEARRKREWTAADESQPLVCRYLLLSRVSLDPKIGGATDSVAREASQLEPSESGGRSSQLP